MATQLKHIFRRLIHSKRALALPITFLILFVSTLGIISFTYYFAVERVGAQGQVLKVSTAKENLLSLDNAILSTLWRPGSSSTFDLADSGGLTSIQPTTNSLTVSINDSYTIAETVFDASVGKVTYQLPYTRSAQVGFYLKGDSRTITNQSGASTSQICIKNGNEHPEIKLCYRPSVTYAAGGLEDGKAVNTIRLYIVNLNTSQAMASQGELALKISSTSMQLSSKDFTVEYAPEVLMVTSVFDSVTDRVSVPISSTAQGAVIHLETVVCNVSIERWIR